MILLRFHQFFIDSEIFPKFKKIQILVKVKIMLAEKRFTPMIVTLED